MAASISHIALRVSPCSISPSPRKLHWLFLQFLTCIVLNQFPKPVLAMVRLLSKDGNGEKKTDRRLEVILLVSPDAPQALCRLPWSLHTYNSHQRCIWIILFPYGRVYFILFDSLELGSLTRACMLTCLWSSAP
jgi:hypothetical protein